MNLIKEQSCVTFNLINDYKLCKLSFMIKKIFENSLNKPNILINVNSNFLPLAFYLKEYANVKAVKNALQGIFSFITHYGKFDLGIFCEKQNDLFVVKFYSGSGYVLSPTVFSILENECSKDFTYILPKNKTLKVADFFNLKTNAFCSKWINKYCSFYKNILLIKQTDFKVISKNELEQKLLDLILNKNSKENCNLKLLPNNNEIVIYKNDKIVNFNSILKQNCKKIASYNEYQMFKCALETNQNVIECDNKIFVAKNTFTFENISFAIYILNNLL